MESEREPAERRTSQQELVLRSSFAWACGVLGDKWVLRIVALTTQGPTRFDDFMHVLPITSNVLAARLKLLVSEGIFEKQPYRETGHRLRYRYALTPSGERLRSVLREMSFWAAMADE